MEGCCPNYGYNHEAKISRNVETMWAKEVASKQKEATTKARKAAIGPCTEVAYVSLKPPPLVAS